MNMRQVKNMATFCQPRPQQGFVLFVFCAGQRYSSRASGLNQSDLLSSGGSVGQLAAVGGGGGGGVYLPDYSVRQLTDLQIIKVTEINDGKKGGAAVDLLPLFSKCSFPAKWKLRRNKGTQPNPPPTPLKKKKRFQFNLQI